MKRWVPAIHTTIVCIVLGLLIVMQLRSTGRAASVALNTSDQALVLTTLVESNAGLRSQIADLQAQLALLDPSDRDQTHAALEAELGRLLVVSGDAEASGPGVRVDVSGQINPLDMQDLINELRNAGAEAIALNSQRIGVRSVVARDGGSLVLDGEHLAAPYVLEAIGQPDTIETALLRRGGLVSLLEFAYPGLKLTVTKTDGLLLPARKVREEFKVAQPVP
jgi:uncharacterized protein YlxW (UPF0749 family)